MSPYVFALTTTHPVFLYRSGASLTLVYGRRYGIIGRNGVGKSTLLRHIALRDVPVPAHITILFVEQEVLASLFTQPLYPLRPVYFRSSEMRPRPLTPSCTPTYGANTSFVKNRLLTHVSPHSTPPLPPLRPQKMTPRAMSSPIASPKCIHGLPIWMQHQVRHVLRRCLLGLDSVTLIKRDQRRASLVGGGCDWRLQEHCL